MKRALVVILVLGLGGCGDASTPVDASTPHDAYVVDAPSPVDAHVVDAHVVDAPPETDAGVPTDAGPATPAHWVMAYYVGYQQSLLPPAEVDFTSITHLAISPVVPRNDGTVDTSLDIDPTAGPALGRDLADRAHAAGRKVILMIGGAGAHDAFASAASPARRAAFVTNLMGAATDLHADGLDLDWEPLDTADQPDFMALATALRTAWPTVILTVPIGYVNANFPTVDAFYGTIAPLFDQLNMMTYGMAGAWPGWQSWHSSALMGEGGSTPTSVSSSAAAYLAAGVPAAKLGVGIGFYGSCWSPPVSAPLQALGASTIVADDNVMTYAHIVSDYPMSGYHYDSSAQAPYLSYATATGAEGCTFVSYEDPTSIAAKGALVAAMHLGGTIIWTVNEGHLTSSPHDPALDAVRHAFLE